MEGLLGAQDEVSQQIYRLFANYKKSKSRITKSFIETRLELLESYWTKFKDNHLDILKLANEDQKRKLSYFTQSEYCKCEDNYLELKTVMKEGLSELAHSHPQQTSSETANIVTVAAKTKLPAINIPSFSGNYKEWSSFYDLFKSLIHDNASLSNIQKYHYLKSNLSGEAEGLLRQFPLTEANYEKALELLQSRYDNKRLIVNAHLSRLFNQKKLTFESGKGIRDLMDIMNESLNALNNIGISTENWDPIITYTMVLKFDNESHRLWEQKLGASKEVPTVEQLKEFMEMRFRSLEAMSIPRSKENTSRAVHNINSFKTQSKPVCTYCSQDHYVYHCKDFGRLSTDDRRTFAKDKHLCFNCLVPKHSVKFCRQNTSCRICKRRHHTLLHVAITQDTKPNKVTETLIEDTPQVSAHAAEVTGSQVLLATAIVKVASRDNTKHILRALIDQGSQASFITTSAVQCLGLRKTPVYSKVNGVDPMMSTVSKGIVEFNICSQYSDKPITKVNAHIMKSLSSILPSKEVNIQFASEIHELSLADPNFNKPGGFDILLGAEVYAQIILQGLIKYGSVIAQNSQLGWLISGSIQGPCDKEHGDVVVLHCQLETDDLLRRFWESEEWHTDTRTMTKSELQCERIYEETHTRTPSGRYIVALPFSSENDTPLGESRTLAVKRLLQMEKRFQRDSKFRDRYTSFMLDYLESGHMERVPQTELQVSNVFYFPHHGVLREESTTTKLRVVFDGSATTNTGQSLNDKLLIGPSLLKDIRDIFFRWRTHEICVVADIKQMYRQILVRHEDMDFQRIVWRNDPQEDVADFRLRTVTYGTSCAPYLAIKTLIQLATDDGEEFLHAAAVVKRDMYMDDLLSGGNSEENVIDLCNELKHLLAKGGFELHKWSSNSINVLQTMTNEDNQQQETINIVMEKTIEALGVKWNPKNDCFELDLNVSESVNKMTKRAVLSDIAKFYDPLGWLSPVVIVAKIFMQKLWLLSLEWDSELPNNLTLEWLEYRNQINIMPIIRLPRWIGLSQSNIRVEIHGFSDASNVAYAGVVYVRVVDKNNDVKVYIVTGKTKVAPVKQISLPRLELCGSVLTAKLMHKVKLCLNIPDENIFGWTDSTIVLAWLQKHPNSWTTFVGYRVTEILNLTRASQWHHINSKENPADCASRGLSPAQLADQELWWAGPTWLSSPESNFRNDYSDIPETNLELKISNFNLTLDEDYEFPTTKFSNLMKLKRVISYCFRFYNLCKQRILTKRASTNFVNELPNFITANEIKNALDVCILISQRCYFSDEIDDLVNGQVVKRKSSLYSLYPFLDVNNVLRVGGRLKNANLPYDTKHPVVLSGKSHLALLIITETHFKTLHGGPLLMLNVIRVKYWITNVKSVIRSHVRRCVKCVRYAPHMASQLMGNLPAARVTVSKAFYTSGVDFAGPIFLKSSNLRKSPLMKAYIALFICTSTKAIHLELVTELSTVAFIAAFKRFTSLRGHCAHLYSDCGTNFIGANYELKRMLQKAKNELPVDIAELLASDGVEWHFIPPGSPHFGGLWEAGVRSVKHHIKRVIIDTKLTFEEYATLLAQIGSCLNSRPISAISDSPDDLSALTPGHFLVFGPPAVIVQENILDTPLNRLSRWQHVEHILQSFWKRWRQEYLTMLQHRYKWSVPQRPVKINDLVIIRDERVPPSKWLLGRIIDTHPGNDGLVRVATINKCQQSIMKRPIQKLCLLPLESSDFERT